MDEWISWQNSIDNTNIEITIHCIENVITKEDVKVSFTIEHNGIVLGESNTISIKPIIDEDMSTYRVDFSVNLPLTINDKKCLNSIVSVPVLIKAVRASENAFDERTTISSVEVKKKSIYSSKSSSVPSSTLFGMCNFDLMPLVLGEESFTEKLILEKPVFSFDGDSVSWENLSRLTVTATQNYLTFFEETENVNFLSITVESIYNLSQSFTDNFNYVAGTIAFVDDEVPKHVIFEDGTWRKYRDIERTKRWNSLPQIRNRARMSKYKLDCDFKNMKNECHNFDLSSKMCTDNPRIEWNLMDRCIIWENGIEAMKRYINKFRYWPLQIEVRERVALTKSKSGISYATQVYQCYIDVSELLFPGRKRCRAAGQLYEYNPMDMVKKTGFEEDIFATSTQQKEMKEKKSKSSKNVQSTVSEDETTSVAIFATNDEPTIIVFEIELFEPLIACRIEQDFSHLIQEIQPKMKDKVKHPYSGNVAEAQYIHCVQKLSEVLAESYRDFKGEKKDGLNCGDESEKYCFHPESDDLTCFTQFLYKTGTYLSVRNSLKMKIPMLIDQKFDLPKNLVGSHETHNFIAAVYVYLVEQMHLAVNKMIEGRHTQDLISPLDPKTFHFYADEAYELGDLDVARKHHTKIIQSDRTNSDSWAKYAIFLRNVGDIERAKECCLEAITLNSKNIIALLVYGTILFDEQDYVNAEIFFRAITNFYPRFYQGWAILHLFYVRTEYYPGIDYTYRIAKECMQDKNYTDLLDHEPLSWTTLHCPTDNLYMMITTFLLKLNFCKFAGIALASELNSLDRPSHILYYTAVEHYLTGRYADALSHLQEAVLNYGMDFSIGSLMGHCYFKLGCIEKAVECYEFARMLFDRPDDLHLVEIRLGYHLYDVGDFERAKRIFLSVCNSSPTSLTWLGAGISFYELSQFSEAELSLLEANRIDNHNPEVWGYLCLLNITLQRYEEFSQCYSEMLKVSESVLENKLKNRKLWLRITNAIEALDYAAPNLAEPEDYTENSSTEDFEKGQEN